MHYCVNHSQGHLVDLLCVCSWAQEFLNSENRGLDVLVDYLSAAHSSVS